MTLKEWVIAGWFHMIVGFVVGWIVFKRPAWADNLINKVLIKLKLKNAG